MRKIDIFTIIFAFLNFLSIIFLIFLGESRPDAYISITILIYFISTPLINPFGERKSRYITVLDVSLFTIFLIIVGYRIYQILIG